MLNARLQSLGSTGSIHLGSLGGVEYSGDGHSGSLPFPWTLRLLGILYRTPLEVKLFAGKQRTRYIQYVLHVYIYIYDIYIDINLLIRSLLCTRLNPKILGRALALEETLDGCRPWCASWRSSRRSPCNWPLGDGNPYEKWRFIAGIWGKYGEHHP